MASNSRPLKISTVGDLMVGKRTLMIASTENYYIRDFCPYFYDNRNCTKSVDGKDYNITLWITAGQEDCDKLRPCCYPNTDCFLLCYSIGSRISFESILSKWYPEIRHFSPDVPIVLVGTQSDLRVPNSKRFVTTAEGKKMKAKIGAFSLVECSAKTMNNIDQVLNEAVRAAENRTVITKQKCQIL